MKPYKNKITKALLVFFSIYFYANLDGMESSKPEFQLEQTRLPQEILNKLNLNKNIKSQWFNIHVIPVVKVEELRESKKSDEWYVLKSKKDIKSNQGIKTEYDVLVAAKQDVEPGTLFGITRVRDVRNRSWNIFLKTIYNTLEQCTNNLYTRKDYKYYYTDDQKLPPYIVVQNGSNYDLYVFLNLLGKKTDEELQKQEHKKWWNLFSRSRVNKWSSRWYDSFSWHKLSEVADLPENIYSILKNNQAALLKMFAQQDTVYDARKATYEALDEEQLEQERRKKDVADLESTIDRAAQGSWLEFENAVYFNEDAPLYNKISLNKELDEQEAQKIGGHKNLQYYYKAMLQNFGKGNDAKPKEKQEAAQDAMSVAFSNLIIALEETKVGEKGIVDLLKSTGDSLIVYADKKDRFFGIGADGKGANKLGLLLMNTRDRLVAPDKKAYTNYGELNLAYFQNASWFKKVSRMAAQWRLLRYRVTGGIPANQPATKVEKPKEQKEDESAQSKAAEAPFQLIEDEEDSTLSTSDADSKADSENGGKAFSDDEVN